MKTIAFYLPQFHEIPENNQWWGEGFTEWTNVKKSVPLYPGHEQPRKPLDNNYYDLSDKKTMEWQAKLAKEYGVYGFCFYHYWFGEKMLLEKPAENLLQWKDIDIHFCFSWANQTWKRTWGACEGNDWVYDRNAKPENDINENSNENEKKGILLEQTYGDEKEWTKHFEYLLPFFQDKRYIKKENKPIFLIYRPTEMKHMSKMFRLWTKLSREHGFDGIYLITTNVDHNGSKYVDAVVQYEPMYTMAQKKERYIKVHDLWEEGLKKKDSHVLPYLYNFDQLWRCILKRKISKRNKTYLGAFVGFDASPRRGAEAKVIYGATPSKFAKYLRELIKKSEDLNNDMIFLTAWNEWGEGAYLEPDEKYKYGYLEAIQKCIKQDKQDE